MKKVISGVHKFQNDVFNAHEKLFNQLAGGQQPEALFITCSDSRIDPCLLTQTEPGDLFVLRNAGNIVPPSGASNGGEAAAVEYAVSVLGVEDIVVCGHSKCGAMQGLLNPESLASLPVVASWLAHAQNTRQVVADTCPGVEGEDLVLEAAKVNALVQLSNLRTHACVAAALAQGKLNLHAWVYTFESGKVLSFDDATQKFIDFPDPNIA